MEVNAHVPNRVAKDLMGVIGQPLGGARCPTPADLRPFWRKVERAIEGLNGTIRLSQVNNRGCHNLAPIILGEATYTALKGVHFDGWEHFKQEVDQRFGLTVEEIETEFYSMRPAAGELVHKFILRVEEARLQMGKGEDALIPVFLPVLTGGFREEAQRQKWSLS